MFLDRASKFRFTISTAIALLVLVVIYAALYFSGEVAAFLTHPDYTHKTPTDSLTLSQGLTAEARAMLRVLGSRTC